MSKIKQTKAPSFAGIAVIDRRNKMRNPFLSQINQLVDWRPISNDREDNRTDAEKEAEEVYQQTVVSTKRGVDEEARWVKKGKEYRYGYKKHTLTDSQGLVLEGHHHCGKHV